MARKHFTNKFASKIIDTYRDGLNLGVPKTYVFNTTPEFLQQIARLYQKGLSLEQAEMALSIPKGLLLEMFLRGQKIDEALAVTRTEGKYSALDSFSYVLYRLTECSSVMRHSDLFDVLEQMLEAEDDTDKKLRILKPMSALLGRGELFANQIAKGTSDDVDKYPEMTFK